MKYENELKKILADVLEQNIEEIEITEDTSLIGSMGEQHLGMSSIDYVEFLVATEKKFGVVYNFETHIDTVGDLIAYIDDKKMYTEEKKSGEKD